MLTLVFFLLDPLNAQALAEEAAPGSPNRPTTTKTAESTVGFLEDDTATMDWDSTDITASHSREELRERLKQAELTALKAKALQKRADAAKEVILDQVQQAEVKCLKEVEMITKTFLMRLNEANDRAAEAEQARYLAEEVKRLTEEKYTLYKYESEKNMHDLKSMFDDALLERDELVAALKTVGKDIDTAEWISPKRRDSIRHLEEKYQRYINTSDRTIQSLKTQLNGVVKHRDQLETDREAARNEMKDTREALEQALKEKEEFQFRLEEAQFEIERLEEMISTMTQKQQQAERERDQLQMLTDMSLMKLRQAESGAPKKRASVAAMPPRINERPKENRDSNLRRLSQQLLHLIGPSTIDKPSKSGESDIAKAAKNAILEERDTSPTRLLEEDYEKPKLGQTERRAGEVVMPPIWQINGTTEIPTGSETVPKENAAQINPSSPHKHIYINQTQSEDDEEQRGHDQMTATKKQPETSQLHRMGENDTNSGAQSTKGSQQFTIPTLHIEEADTDAEMGNLTEVPEIEISDVDENELRGQQEEEEADDHYNPEAPVFIVEGEDGQTRIVYSFDDISELLEGIPQTSL